MDLTERIETVKFLLHDRDSRLTAAFDAVFVAEGIRIVRTPPPAPLSTDVTPELAVSRVTGVSCRMSGTQVRRDCGDGAFLSVPTIFLCTRWPGAPGHRIPRRVEPGRG
jgi:hypothetical protein